MKNFEYVLPATLAEAVELLHRFGAKATIMAGGTELINQMRKGTARPEKVVDLKAIAGLDGIQDDDGGLRIGGLTRIAEIAASPLIEQRCAALRDAARSLGSPQVRNKATLAGNICRASPSADMVPPLIALSSTVKVAGPAGERVLQVEDLFVGPGKTALAKGEIVTTVLVAPLEKNSACVYLKLSPRKAMDLAVVGVAAMLTLDARKSRCSRARIVLGAVAPTAIRARKAEAALEAGKLGAPLIEEVALIASAECSPISDVRASEWYRREMVAVMVKRAVTDALKQIGEARS